MKIPVFISQWNPEMLSPFWESSASILSHKVFSSVWTTLRPPLIDTTERLQSGLSGLWSYRIQKPAINSRLRFLTGVSATTLIGADTLMQTAQAASEITRDFEFGSSAQSAIFLAALVTLPLVGFSSATIRILNRKSKFSLPVIPDLTKKNSDSSVENKINPHLARALILKQQTALRGHEAIDLFVLESKEAFDTLAVYIFIENNPKIIDAALHYLLRIDTIKALPLMVALASITTHRQIASACVFGVAKIGLENRKEMLQIATEAKLSWIRHSIMFYIVKHSTTEQAFSYLTDRIQNDPDRDVILEAISFLSELEHPSKLKVLHECILKSQLEPIKERAINNAVKIDRETLIPTLLKKAISDPSENIRTLALLHLAETNSEQARLALHDIFISTGRTDLFTITAYINLHKSKFPHLYEMH